MADDILAAQISSSSPTETSSLPPREEAPATAARVALLLAIAWLATGALFKLLAGSPNDLPDTIKDFPLLRPEWTFRLAIGVELSLCALALVRPRVGWILIVLLFGFFDFLLYKITAAGETSCGCFGGNAPSWLKPQVMMGVDSVLLLGVLFTRPWRSFGTARPTLLPVPILTALMLAVLMLLPWHSGCFQVATPPAPTLPPSGEAPAAQAQAPATAGGDWYGFTPSEWAHKVIADTDLAQWIEGGAEQAYTIPAPAHVVVYRVDCEHCRKHFIKLQENPPELPIALIRVPDANPGDDVTSDVKPANVTVELSLVPLPKGYGITTPVAFNLDEAWTIGDVIERSEDE